MFPLVAGCPPTLRIPSHVVVVLLLLPLGQNHMQLDAVVSWHLQVRHMRFICRGKVGPHGAHTQPPPHSNRGLGTNVLVIGGGPNNQPPANKTLISPLDKW